MKSEGNYCNFFSGLHNLMENAFVTETMNVVHNQYSIIVISDASNDEYHSFSVQKLFAGWTDSTDIVDDEFLVFLPLGQ